MIFAANQFKKTDFDIANCEITLTTVFNCSHCYYYSVNNL
jgi:hypothetical protein